MHIIKNYLLKKRDKQIDKRWNAESETKCVFPMLFPPPCYTDMNQNQKINPDDGVLFIFHCQICFVGAEAPTREVS
jgi:hypothetical protein